MRLLPLFCCLIVSAAIASPKDVRITFAAMGDVPYRPEERVKLAADLLRLPQDTAFIVHLGDIKPGTPFCGEREYADIARILKGSKVPVFIIPGDNEWNDCSRPGRAWGYWLDHFKAFEGQWSGFEDVARQESHQANFAFVRNSVLFVGLHLVGGRVHDKTEWDERHEADLEWLRTHLLQRRKENISTAVVFGHSQPSTATKVFFESFGEIAEQFARPVLYVHGDGHRWVREKSFKVRQMQRIQVDQGGNAPPLLITVTDDVLHPFVVDRRLPDTSASSSARLPKAVEPAEDLRRSGED